MNHYYFFFCFKKIFVKILFNFLFFCRITKKQLLLFLKTITRKKKLQNTFLRTEKQKSSFLMLSVYILSLYFNQKNEKKMIRKLWKNGKISVRSKKIVKHKKNMKR